MATRVATAAAKVAPVVRVDTDDPVAAARALTRAAFPAAATAWVAGTGRATDLAVAASTAAARRSPLVVVDEDARSLPAADLDLLADLGVRSATVVGGRESVRAGVADALTEALGDEAVRRAEAGDEAALAARVHTLSWGRATAAAAYVANADRPTDAFTGAVLAGRARVPLYWTRTYCLPAPSREGVLAATVARVTVLGGEQSVRSLVDDLTACRSTQDPSSTWVLVNKRNGLSPQSFRPSDLEVPAMEHAGGHGCGRRPPRPSPPWRPARSRPEPDRSASTPPSAPTPRRTRSTRSGSPAVAGPGPTPGTCGPGTASTRPASPSTSSRSAGPSCTINDCIDETPQGAWLARSSWRYGFILRYERGHTATTGVGFEPWHFRYVGKDVARAYHEGGWDTYEEFLGRPAAPTY